MGKDVRTEIAAMEGRINNIRPREMEQLAQEAGWREARTTGGHVQYSKAGQPRPIPIPRHSKAMRGFIAKKILRQIREALDE